MLEIEKKNLYFELKIESIDDLWSLSEFILPEDIIFSTTLRKVKLGNETNSKQIKKIIFVELKVKKTKFENQFLRISGEIQNETEFTTIGQNHSLTYNLNDKIKIQKKSLLNFEKKLLENSCKTRNSQILLILIDKTELIVTEFSNISYRILFSKKELGSKKYFKEEINENEEKYKLIENYIKKDYYKIIFSGPGIYKENLSKYIKDKLGTKILTLSFPEINSENIQKIIEKIQKSGILSENQIANENEKISKLLENINLNTKFSYGIENTFKSVNEGKIKIFLITTKLIEKFKDEEKYLELNNILKIVENLKGELLIINSKNNSGKILDGLSGIASINRY